MIYREDFISQYVGAYPLFTHFYDELKFGH